VLWIWDYFHDKGLLFQGQGLIGVKGVQSDISFFIGAYILVHINLACVIVHLVFQGFSV
jgi:hypothetical protein